MSGLPSLGSAQESDRLTIYVGYPPGANYDLHGRILSRHIGKNLPNRATVIVQNMPGAGSLRLANYLYNVAPKDGSAIGLFARGMAAQPLLDPAGIQFDPKKFGWIGSPSSEASVVFSWHDKPFKTLDDARGKEMVVAATGSGSDSIIFPSILNGVLGTKFKVIAGYPGSADLLLAVERGEVDGNAGTSWGNLVANRQDWISDKKINVLVQLGTRRHPDLQNVPFVMDFAKSPAEKQILELIFSRQTAAYPFAAPPSLPQKALTQLRTAFDKTMKDSEYVAEAKKATLEIDPTSGEEIERTVSALYDTPSEVLDRAKAIIRAGDGAAGKRN